MRDSSASTYFFNDNTALYTLFNPFQDDGGGGGGGGGGQKGPPNSFSLVTSTNMGI